MRKIFKKRSGFSMIELVVAIFIITTALVSVVSLANKNIQAQSINENTLTASLLAQEGLEIVRNMRDSNWQNGDDWLGVSPGYDLIQDGDYGVDYNFNIINYNDIDDAIIYKQGGFYSHDIAGEQTIFRRLINVAFDLADPDKLEVDCTVKWTNRGNDQTYVASMELYNWW